MGAVSDDGCDDQPDEKQVAEPIAGPWRARRGVDTWLVSRTVVEAIENLYYAPPGFRDSPVLASFKTEREADKAAKEANAAESTNHRRSQFNEF